MGAEPGHAALADRRHRGLRGEQAIGGRARSRHALRPVHPHRAPQGRRPAARRGQRRAAPVPARQRGLRLRLALHEVHLRPLRRRRAARDGAHLGQLPDPVLAQPPDRQDRRQAVHRALRRLEDVPARSLRHGRGGRRAARAARRSRAHAHRRGQQLRALAPRREGAVLAAVRRLHAAVGALARGRRRRRALRPEAGAKRRAARGDGTVRRRVRRLDRLRAGPRVPARLLVRGPVPVGRAHEPVHAPDHRRARARSVAVARRPARRVLQERAQHERARGDGHPAGSRAVGRVARRALRRGLPAGVEPRRYAHRVLGVAEGWLPRHRRRRARVGPRRADHARPRGRPAAGVVRRRPLRVLLERSHRHLEHLRVRHARCLDLAGHERRRRRVHAAAVADRQAARLRVGGARRRLRSLRAAVRSVDVAARARVCR